jgi:hypothetical protein
MGIALVLIGLFLGAVVVDFAVENDVVGAPERSFSLFGGTFSMNETQVVLAAAIVGGLAVLFFVLGLTLARGSLGRRRDMRRRVRTLERENADLKSRPRVVVGGTTDEAREVREDDRERREAFG